MQVYVGIMGAYGSRDTEGGGVAPWRWSVGTVSGCSSTGNILVSHPAMYFVAENPCKSTVEPTARPYPSGTAVPLFCLEALANAKLVPCSGRCSGMLETEFRYFGNNVYLEVQDPKAPEAGWLMPTVMVPS